MVKDYEKGIRDGVNVLDIKVNYLEILTLKVRHRLDTC